MGNGMVCRVTRGELSKQDSAAVMMAVEDLRTYWQRAFGADSFLLAGEAPERQADLDLSIGSAENLPRIRAMIEEERIDNAPPPEQGYALDILRDGGKCTAVLRAADRLGLQYAVYGFAEHFLGVRFVHPLLGLQPRDPPMPGELRLIESPSAAFRVLYETSHVQNGLRGTSARSSHYSDVGSWRWEDWAGNPERMRHFIAWGVKNRANIIFFEDTLYDSSKYSKPFVVSDALWRYLDTRGLKTLAACSSAYLYEDRDRWGKDDCCDHNAARVGFWDRHLCVGKPGYWQDLEEWLDVLEPHAHRLAGLFTNWQENVCGEGVTEGAEDGVIHSAAGLVFDMNSARFREPVLSKGGGCLGCGHMTNVEKWVTVSDYLRGPKGAAAHGLPPAGITRTYWGVAPPDDGMVAERIVPHLPPDSVSFVACLPSYNRVESVEAWPRIMDEVNRADDGNRRVVLMRELQYACGSDMPIVPFTNLDRIDDDFRVFGKYESAATAFGGVYVYHSMGWLLTLYSMRKQWQTGLDWRSWFRRFFRGLLADEFIETFLEIVATLQRVQLLEGLEPGEEPGGYYSRWGLDLSKLAPETLPAEGPLKIEDRFGKDRTHVCRSSFVRLVQAGSADPRGDYTSERCAPALQRVLSLRAKIEHTLGQVPILKDHLPDGEDSLVWNELVLLPVRVTARFLQCRVLLAQSYMTYIRMREGVLKGQDTATDAAEGEALCRQALATQDEYIRLRPGFGRDYPLQVSPDTLRSLIMWWRRLRAEPEICRGLDICEFLDRAEAEAAV